MKKQVVFIHGGEAYSNYEDFLDDLKESQIRNLPGTQKEERWTHSLEDDLGSDFEVFKPSMPNSSNAKYLEWKIWFEKHFEFLRDGVVLIGHSQGGMFLTKYLIENETPFAIKALFLAGSVYDGSEVAEGFREDGGDFTYDLDKVPTLSSRVDNVFIMHSKDDFVVPFSHGEALAKVLPEAEFMVFEDKNHFLIEEFPELITKIKAIS